MTNDEYDFGVTLGALEISIEQIELSLPANTTYEGSFDVRAVGGGEAEGYIYTTSNRMEVVQTYFRGEKATIEYEFSTKGLKDGETSEGEIIMLTNKGEYIIDYSVKVEVNYTQTSMGPIKNLFHFANLAKDNYIEALELYYSKNFENILVGHDAKYLSAYRALSSDNMNTQQMDEFLVAVKKKSRVTYELESKVITVHNPIGPVNKEIIIRKSNWGDVWLSVECDEDFARFEQTEYMEGDFADNICKIAFTIDPERLYAGNNFATVAINTSAGDEFKVVIVVANHAKDVATAAGFLRQKAQAKLVKDYIEFRLGKLELTEWTKRSYDNIEYITGFDEADALRMLYQIQLLVAEERISDATYVLEKVEREFNVERLSTEIYAYYLYITTLLNRDGSFVDKVAHKVKRLYSRNELSSHLAWLMVYLNEELYFKIDKKWDFLEDQYRIGSSSAILYAESMELLTSNPGFLVKLSGYEVELLKFAIKHEVLNAEIADRVGFLLSREKDFNRDIYEIATYLYDRFGGDELLFQIVSYIMRGNCIAGEYFKWYELGVKKELRITRLYEFYMYSIDTEFKGEIPKMILMYFAYQNNLDHEKMAFLYAYVMSNRVRYPEIAESYQNNLNAFLKEQLSKERINPSLIYLYQKFVDESLVDEDTAKYIGNMLFIHEIKAPSDKMVNCIVMHHKTVGEKVYPVNKGKAYATIYSKEYTILWEDDHGNRFLSESFIPPTALFKDTSLIDVVFATLPDKLGLVMYKTENENDGQICINDENVFNYEKMFNADVFNLDYRREILYHLICYYFEKDNYKELDELLPRVRPEVTECARLGEIVQIMISRGLYDEALRIVIEYGPEYVSDTMLMRLVSRVIERRDYEENEQIVCLCRYIYKTGKYDQIILKYLSDYCFDANSRYCKLYNDAVSFGVEVYTLLDRMMTQVLFAGGRLSRYFDYFEEYLQVGGKVSVQKAFLSQYSYDFFVRDIPMERRVLNSILSYYKSGEDFTRIMRLAFLKYESECEESEWEVDIITDAINTELGFGKEFPFFSIFASKVKAAEQLVDRTYVEYKGQTDSRVIIHYCLEHEATGETEYRKEEMNHLYGGIFVKDFVMFSGEEIQYYITEEVNNSEQLTQSSVIKKNEELSETTEFRYTLLNEAVISKSLDDYESAVQNYYDYILNDYLVGEIFNLC